MNQLVAGAGSAPYFGSAGHGARAGGGGAATVEIPIPQAERGCLRGGGRRLGRLRPG
jgi:hypothetical protein